MLRYLMIIVLSLALTNLRAQFSDSITKHISLSATGVLNKTDEGSSYVLNNTLHFNIRRKDVSLNAGGGWIYGEQNGRRSNNDYNASVDFNLFKTWPHFYYWGLATYEKSQSLKINDRAQVGGGVAYSVFDKPQVFLNISEGVLFEKSDLFLDETTREQNTVLRNSFRIRYRWTIKNRVVLDGTHFIQNALSDFNDHILRSNNGLSIKINKWLNFTTALTYNKVNKTGRENLLLTFGLNMEKYF